MPTHYHLLVQTPEGNLSRYMRHINGVCTQRFNRQNNKEGQLFRGRYKAVLVDKDRYLLEVLRCIHRNPLKAGLENFYLMKHLPSMLGSSTFKEYIKEKFIALTNRVEIPESKTLAPDSDKIISCVCEYYNVTKKELLHSKRGTENIARDLAIYLVRRLCCKTLPKIGVEFSIDNYSTVSSVFQRVKMRVESDRALQKELRIIEEKTHKSQK